MDAQAISFGPFRLFAEQRLLLEGDRPVRLGSRAFDILTALVERPGKVVGKEQLIARAWPQTFVEAFRQWRAFCAERQWRYHLIGSDAAWGIALALRGQFREGIAAIETAIVEREREGYHVVADWYRG